jgi:hypothetical protein
MAVSNYPGRTVLVGFFVRNQKAGTKDERDQFSQSLSDAFDATIVAECNKAGIDPSARVRASIAVMANNAPGGNSPAKARRAVAAYKEFKGIP